ncbi:MAG TPA: fibrobacter succinogenes major paralogous domain-containing protein [Chitinophagales bacterium]|nr:fibrobacter succinogenes major paralogous domain-containing protein [Chitinophagales bacterium]
MKSRISILKLFSVLTLISLFAIQCKKDGSNDPLKDTNGIKNKIIEEQNARLSSVIPTTTEKFKLKIQVFDESEKTLSGATVKVGGQTKQTDNKGSVEFESVSLNTMYAVITSEKTGYMKGTRTIVPVKDITNTAFITLQTKGPKQTIDASKGGELKFDSEQVILNFPAGCIADANGDLYSGIVHVFARYINTDAETDEAYYIIPGNSKGLTNDNKIVNLYSDGMLNVELTDEKGNPLQILIGKTVKVTIPNYYLSISEMPAWHFNETYGLWLQSGTATTNGTHYSFEANHFSTWSIGEFVTLVENTTVTIIDTYGNPIKNQYIGVYTQDYEHFLQGVTTDDKGRIYLLPVVQFYVLQLDTDCQNLVKLVDMTSSEIVVVFPISNMSTQTFQFSGTLRDCSGVLKNSKYQLVGITDGKINVSGQTDANGKINISKTLCDLDASISHKVQLMVIKSDNTTRHEILNIDFNKSTISMDYNLCSSTLFQTPYLNTSLIYGTVKDNEGYTYPTIQIGNQTWMAENLRVSKLNNGTAIPNVIAHGDWKKTYTPAWSFYENNNDYHQLFGKIYNWHAVNTGKLCPTGWHVPSSQEWSTLKQTIGVNAGGEMKILKVWYPTNLGATNSTGFSALSGGKRIDFGFTNVGHRIHFSTSTERTSTSANEIYLTNGSTSVFESFAVKEDGAYCRCVKN